MIGRISVAIYKVVADVAMYEWRWHLTIHDDSRKLVTMTTGAQPTRADAFKAVAEVCDEIEESMLPVGPMTF